MEPITRTVPDPLKVLVITGTWPPMRCGVGDYSFMLCEHLARLGVSVQVLTSRQAQPDLRVSAHNRLEVLPRIETWGWGALGTVRRTVEELKPHVVDIQWPTAAYGRSPAVNLLPLSLRLLALKLPVVTTLHEVRNLPPWTRQRLWPTYLASHRLIVVDPLDLRYIHCPKSAGRCVHIPIGSNLPSTPAGFDRAACRRDLGLAESDFAVGFFGFANPPKGLETLFAALGRLKGSRPGLKLLLLSQLSEDHAYERRLLHELKHHGLEDITLRPPYAEPRLAAEILAAADCAALPFLDGVSVKRGSLMACLAQGLPIVTTVPARGEVGEFQHGVNMWLVPPRDPEALAQALDRVWRDPDLRARLALGAWELARLFSWEDIARRQLEVFRQVWQENG
jgi:glycosyltransferase involved in cell wall biosynthesis